MGEKKYTLDGVYHRLLASPDNRALAFRLDGSDYDLQYTHGPRMRCFTNCLNCCNEWELIELCPDYNFAVCAGATQHFPAANTGLPPVRCFAYCLNCCDEWELKLLSSDNKFAVCAGATQHFPAAENVPLPTPTSDDGPLILWKELRR
ncbi:hypothetical protein CASFOL_035283 [Castilleja foliolosa]|uniref:Uncharacterized protein n=1 Tax=Castilleja foliolosa TaxID=1961234 RepID=A0ABD3BTE0_9LAMI